MPHYVPRVLYSFDLRAHSAALIPHSGFQLRFKLQILQLHRLMSKDGFVTFSAFKYG